MIDFHGKTAFVTGASSGIGLAFAKILAVKGANVILVARSGDKLRKLAADIKKESKVKADVVVADLSGPKAPSKVYGTAMKKGYKVDVLINNAGFGTHGEFHTLSADREHQEVMLNVAAVVQLTHLFLPDMLKRKDGIIVSVASTGAFQPVPYNAVYGATKAFVLSFSEALWAEYRKQGVRILALCPGSTDTNFFNARGSESSFAKQRTTEGVMETALKAVQEGSHTLLMAG